VKIAVIGADGQLGYDLCRVIPQAELIPLTVKELDITDRAKTVQLLKTLRPGAVINTAAYTAVDAAETDQAAAKAVNETGAQNVAEACREIDATMVQISTDYVFDGTKPVGQPYTEDDPPAPNSVYGRTKLAGEEWVKKTLRKYFIVRSAGLYGIAGCLGKGGGNFVEAIIRQADRQEKPLIVDDEYVSPTYTCDLAEKLCQLLKTDRYGLYHLVNQGQCSWYVFGDKVLELLGSELAPERIGRQELGAKANRPANSVLASVKLQAAGLSELRPWPDALKAYLTEKGRIR